MSNRMFAFKALGVSLEPAPEQWAVWATLGWFPLQMTGYKRIRFLEPATRLRWSAEGIRRTRYDVLSAWVQPPPAVAGGLSRASPGGSLLEYIKGCVPLWDKPKVGLTGSWDSRAVVSVVPRPGRRFLRGCPRPAGAPRRRHGLRAGTHRRLQAANRGFQGVPTRRCARMPPVDRGRPAVAGGTRRPPQAQDISGQLAVPHTDTCQRDRTKWRDRPAGAGHLSRPPGAAGSSPDVDRDAVRGTV